MSEVRKISAIQIPIQPVAMSLKRLPSTPEYKAVDYELNKFTGVTTFHGLVRLYSGRWYAKFFWMAVVFVAIGLFVWQVSTLMNYLNNKPTLTKVKFVVKNGIRFPSVTICNYNPVRQQYIDELNASSQFKFTDDVLEYILLSYLQVENLYEEYSNNSLSVLDSAYINFTNAYSGFKIDQFFMDAGYSCEEMFLSCKFGGTTFDCCKFATPILTDIGKCYQFHNFSGQSFRNYQYISGSFYGLQLILNVNYTQYPQVFLDNSFETGVRFFVHAQGVMPFLSSGGFSISPGFRLYAGITQTHHMLLGKDEWGNCKPSWEIEEEHYTDTYTSSNCEAHCVAKQFNKTCGCTPLRYNINDAYAICNPWVLYNCIQVNKWDVEDEEYWYKKCPQCTIECDRWEYTLETSYSNFYNYGARKYMTKRFHMPENLIAKNIVILDAYLKEIAYTDFEQVQGTSVTETLSDIGGSMGMFIGASIITLAEISVFLLKVLWSSMSRKRRLNVVQKTSSVDLPDLVTSRRDNNVTRETPEPGSPIGRPIQFWIGQEDNANGAEGMNGRKVRFSSENSGNVNEDAVNVIVGDQKGNESRENQACHDNSDTVKEIMQNKDYVTC